jgi:hypothetical protein
MRRIGARFACFACTLVSVSRVAAEPAVIVPCEDFPTAVAVLGSKSEIEAYGLAAAASVAVAAIPSLSGQERSVLRFARDGAPPREVHLAGRVLGLAVTSDGKHAYATVRATDRKGVVRSVELVRVDLETARATSGATLPATARGLALGSGNATLLVASHNEIRTFQLPSLASGPLYRALGDNVGVAPLPGSSYVLVAQPSRIVVADLAATQGRDGLTLSDEVVAPAPLRGMLASAGDAGPVALSDGGVVWCVRAGAPPRAPRVQDPPADPLPEEPPQVESAPVAPAASHETAAPQPIEPGTVFGSVGGPAVADVAAIVLLGPDNVLHEAARAVPDERGRYSASALPPGGYRIVAAGKAGRVLICDPPFITIRVDSNGAVAAPVLKVLRSQ